VTLAAAVTVTSAAPTALGSATLVAVTVKVPGVLPAVKSPFDEIVPPLADHVTPVLPVPVTLAENCRVWPVETVAWPGVTVTVIGCVEVTMTLSLAPPNDALTVAVPPPAGAV
jgi:hypothetical protein